MQISVTTAAHPTVNSLTWLLAAVDQLATVGGALLPLAQAWGYVFGVLAFIIVCFKGCIYALRNQGDLVIPDMIAWSLRVMFVGTALSFYVVPIPGIGVAFPDIFTAIGRQIAGTIGVETLDLLLGQINDCAAGLEHPPVWNFFGLIIYFFVLMSMTMLDAMLLLVIGLGFIAVALGKVFGSIMITFYLLPGWSDKFWNWVNFMFVYSLYRAMASAYVLVIATFLVNFFQNSVHGNYTIGHFSALFVLMISGIVMAIVGAFKVPHWAVELFGGGLGHAGSEFGGTMKSLLLMLVRP